MGHTLQTFQKQHTANCHSLRQRWWDHTGEKIIKITKTNQVNRAGNVFGTWGCKREELLEGFDTLIQEFGTFYAKMLFKIPALYL